VFFLTSWVGVALEPGLRLAPEAERDPEGTDRNRDVTQTSGASGPANDKSAEDETR
jgi:hypothetical protein